jgi:hypothetical protein
MKQDFEPALQPVEIATLKPTQMTIGLREVERKRTEWRKHAERDGPDFLGRHMIPAVRGPGSALYLIDNHHLVRALHDEGVGHVLVKIIAELDDLKKSEFWVFMDNRNWLHPFDADGERQDYDQLPKKIGAMADDPYRSLAGELRRAGGFAKDTTPFSEFIWADFLRRRMKRSFVDKDFERALDYAMELAKNKEADYLPGWCGPSPEE